MKEKKSYMNISNRPIITMIFLGIILKKLTKR